MQILILSKSKNIRKFQKIESAWILLLEHIAGYSSDVETTLTLNADGTYLLTQTFKEKQNERDKLRGTFQVLDGNILILVHPSSDDNIFYKMKNYSSIILIDSSKNEPKRKEAKHFVLRKKAQGTVQFHENVNSFQRNCTFVILSYLHNQLPLLPVNISILH